MGQGKILLSIFFFLSSSLAAQLPTPNEGSQEIPKLVARLKESDPEARMALRSLARFGAATGPWAAQLASIPIERPTLGTEAIEALSQSREGLEALANLLGYAKKRLTPALRLKAISWLEIGEDELDAEGKVAISKALQRHWDVANEIDQKRVLCRLAEMSPYLVEQATHHADNGDPSVTWSIALRALGYLFLSEASPFCPKVENELRKQINQAFRAVTPEEIERLNPFSDALYPNLETILSSRLSSGIYAKQFLVLLLHSLRRQPWITAGQSRKLSEWEKLAEKALNHGLERFHSFIETSGNNGNSGYSLYAIATGTLASLNPPRAVVSELEKTALLFSPLNVPYSLGLVGVPVPSHNSAARAVPYYLALSELASSCLLKEVFQQSLLQSLENYVTSLSVLIAHSGRNGTHATRSRIAPYFFYSTIPYAAAGVRKAMRHPKTTGAERKKLEDFETKLKRGLFSLLQSDGTFHPLGDEDYFSSRGYSNPLAGLALVAWTASQKEPRGILRPSP